MQHTVTPAEVTAVISASIAVATFLIGRLTAMKEGVSDKARMGDRLDRIWETCSDTRDAVREMSRKLDDHSERLTRVEQQVQALTTRVERVEDNCDARFRTGGTDERKGVKHERIQGLGNRRVHPRNQDCGTDGSVPNRHGSRWLHGFGLDSNRKRVRRGRRREPAYERGRLARGCGRQKPARIDQGGLAMDDEKTKDGQDGVGPEDICEPIEVE